MERNGHPALKILSDTEKMNPKKSILRLITVKLLRSKGKEKNLKGMGTETKPYLSGKNNLNNSPFSSETMEARRNWHSF